MSAGACSWYYCACALREREQAPALHTLREDRNCNALNGAGDFREAYGVSAACRRFRPDSGAGTAPNAFGALHTLRVAWQTLSRIPFPMGLHCTPPVAGIALVRAKV